MEREGSALHGSIQFELSVRPSEKRTQHSMQQRIILGGRSFDFAIGVDSSDKHAYTSRTRASRAAEVSRFKKCSAIGSKNKFCL